MAEYKDITLNTYSDLLAEPLPSLFWDSFANQRRKKELNMLSLFSGCGGMDIGFEGGFICNRKSVPSSSGWVDKTINQNWVLLKKNNFRTIFANDILKEAQLTWLQYMQRFAIDPAVYHFGSIVDLVKLHEKGYNVFPSDVDIVTGGFPCQDFSVAGKRKGFESTVSHNGERRIVSTE